MVFHQAIRLALCHYCDSTAAVPPACPACEGKLVLFGLGIQRIENELARKFPNAAVARMDSDTMTSPEQFQKVLTGFSAGQIDILLGTQMVAKGLDFPKVTLVGIASADTALEIPDFRASERTFQLIVQVAGRAGRADRPGQVIVQTWHPDDPAIRFALRHDYAGFSSYELPLRKSAAVPPFVRLVRFIVRHQHQQKADDGVKQLAAHLHQLFDKDKQVRIVGPMPAGIFKIRNQFRFQVNCFCAAPSLIQNALYGQMAGLSQKIGADIVVDVDPVNLM
jgi:primosomal protein N' (replication factor Y)